MEEMLSGEIRIAPYKHKDGTSCDFVITLLYVSLIQL